MRRRISFLSAFSVLSLFLRGWRPATTAGSFEPSSSTLLSTLSVSAERTASENERPTIMVSMTARSRRRTACKSFEEVARDEGGTFGGGSGCVERDGFVYHSKCGLEGLRMELLGLATEFPR